MTLPVALLIACYKNESISNEIREIAGERLSLLESLSCKCKDHLSRLCLVPPSPCCSPLPTYDTGSEASRSSSNTAKSYSYFSDICDFEDLLLRDSTTRTDIDVGRCLSVLVDLVENVTFRFNESYIFREDEVKVTYQKRDILNLGENMQGNFPLKHPVQRNFQVRPHGKSISIRTTCPISDCEFQDLLLLS